MITDLRGPVVTAVAIAVFALAGCGVDTRADTAMAADPATAHPQEQTVAWTTQYAARWFRSPRIC